VKPSDAFCAPSGTRGVCLILQLVVEGEESTAVAAQRGVNRAALVEELRHAVAALASRYEYLANHDLNELPALSLPTAPARTRG
jgi:hypothetical protein